MKTRTKISRLNAKFETSWTTFVLLCCWNYITLSNLELIQRLLQKAHHKIFEDLSLFSVLLLWELSYNCFFFGFIVCCILDLSLFNIGRLLLQWPLLLQMKGIRSSAGRILVSSICISIMLFKSPTLIISTNRKR